MFQFQIKTLFLVPLYVLRHLNLCEIGILDFLIVKYTYRKFYLFIYSIKPFCCKYHKVNHDRYWLLDLLRSYKEVRKDGDTIISLEFVQYFLVLNNIYEKLQNCSFRIYYNGYYSCESPPLFLSHSCVHRTELVTSSLNKSDQGIVGLMDIRMAK